VQDLWNRGNHTVEKAFSLRFIIKSPDRREVPPRLLQCCLCMLLDLGDCPLERAHAGRPAPHVSLRLTGLGLPEQVEGTWSAEAVMEVLRHLDQEPDLANGAHSGMAAQEAFESVAA
jgi:hypothetical protein